MDTHIAKRPESPTAVNGSEWQYILPNHARVLATTCEFAADAKSEKQASGLEAQDVIIRVFDRMLNLPAIR